MVAKAAVGREERAWCGELLLVVEEEGMERVEQEAVVVVML